MNKCIASNELSSYLAAQKNMKTLRFITCGSVDDGKSTLIGRLLFESKAIFDDQLKSLESDSKKYGTQGEKIDFALLVDGLQAEREQGITIDVAYRFFSTEKRNFIVADTPGHIQYTRNMATGASTAALAIILIDARKGVLLQTRRHSRIAAMMGIKHVILAINKIDLVDYNENIFFEIIEDYKKFSAELNFSSVQAIPVSGLEGDNITKISLRMPWYDGPTLMQYIEEIDVDGSDYNKSLRFPVQWVNRPDLNFRGFCGCLAQGTVRLGDAVRVLPSGVITKIKSIYHGFNHVKKAVEGNAVTLTLDDEVDVSRGDVIVSLDAPFEMANQFEAKLLWLNDNPLFPGRQYILKIGTKEVIATVNSIKYSIDVNSGGHLVAKLLDVNDIGVVNIITSEPILCEEYSSSRTLGGFILIDKQSFATAGAGMIDFALRRSGNINWQKLDVNKILRSGQKNQTPKCFWLTGLSGSGKSTIANLLERRLFSENKHTYILDGDNLRYGLNKNLGFNQSDRVENIRRVAEVAKLMVDAGLVVIVSAISPFRDDRNMARSLFDEDEFVEIFVDASIDVCEKRDVKGLYLKARQGQLKNFTGIDSPYEPPENPEITLRTEDKSIDDCVNQLINYFHLCQ